MIPAELQTLANHVWQSTLFAAAAGLLTLALKKNRAQIRYGLWLAASVKFLIPFSILVDTGSHFGRHIPAAIPESRISYVIGQVSRPFAAPVPFAAAPALPHSSPSLIPVIFYFVWAIGFATLVCSWWLRWRGIRTALRSASPLQLPIDIAAMTSPAFREPGVFGIHRPVLLLPAGITSQLTSAQLEAVLAHETCHVRRRDNLATGIHMAVEALFWFHPLVWWLGARLIEERERACDEDVLRTGTQPEVYAQGILRVCELYLKSPLPCVGGVTGGNLTKRIEAIMTTKRIANRLNFAKKAMLAAAGVMALAGPVGIGIMNAPAIRAQAAPGTNDLSFEAASVKPSPPVPEKGGVYFGPPSGGPGTPEPGQITWSYAPMKGILMEAYGVATYQVSGPAWLGSQRYDIVAKVPAGATKEQVSGMWRNLLAERFGVVLHHESREFQVQELVVSKGGAKLKETAYPNEPWPPGPPKVVNGELVGPGMVHTIRPNEPHAHTMAIAQPISKLTTMIGNQLHCPVLDKTGLTGKYDFTFDFTPDLKGFAPLPPEPGQPTPASAAAGQPDLAAVVLQQLGLGLVANKANLDVVVIDKIEKTPTGN